MFAFSVPPNVRFEIDDVEEEWIESLPFDYIHSRFMNASIANWKEYIKNCFEYFISSCHLWCSRLTRETTATSRLEDTSR